MLLRMPHCSWLLPAPHGHLFGGEQLQKWRFKLLPAAVPLRVQVLKCRNRESGEIVAIKKFKSRIDGENADAAQVRQCVCGCRRGRRLISTQLAECAFHTLPHAACSPTPGMLARPPTLAALFGYVGAQDGAA